jgi:hypothetical protein
MTNLGSSLAKNKPVIGHPLETCSVPDVTPQHLDVGMLETESLIDCFASQPMVMKL